MVLKYFSNNLMVLALVLITQAVYSAEPQINLPFAKDLWRDAGQARVRGLPIMIVFSASYCEHCRKLEEEFIKPMMMNKQYTDSILIRMIDIDSSETMRDFEGMSVSQSKFASTYRISLTPTIVFVDSQGHLLRAPLIGLNTVEFFGWYLDQAIEESRALIRANTSDNTSGMRVPPLIQNQN